MNCGRTVFAQLLAFISFGQSRSSEMAFLDQLPATAWADFRAVSNSAFAVGEDGSTEWRV